ncbi:gamma tubulin complex component 4 [Echinococcus multilocularis]|uniref:Gamma-tubulin complex component n=1 Tax=Echinococcus multilocularis TaxID=6211 RepID=A0A068Y2V4_ECHMU|nr:gamma tubulin complex component 4 [Echinococcus multilocularis]
MLHELIFCLHGFPGDICTHLSVDDPSQAPEYRLKLLSERLPFIAPGEIGLVKQMHHVGESYLRLQKFICNFYVPGSGSLYLTALACGLDEVLEEYRAAIASIEAELLKTPYLGITYIFSKVEPFRAVLNSLTHLLDLCVKNHQNHSCIINSVLLMNKSPAVTSILKHLLQLFRHQLSSWLLYGAINDPYEEFCVSCECELVPNKFPNIISPTLANDILYAGKAVRSGGTELTDHLEEAFSQRFAELENTELIEGVDEGLERLIRDIWLYVSGEVWRRMFEEFGLVHHLNLVRDVMLLGRGELYVAFLDNLLAEGDGTGRGILDRPIPATVAEAKNLSYVVGAAFLAAARSVGMEDEELVSCFRFVVSTNPHEVALLSKDLGDDRAEAIGYHPTAWDCLRLEFAPIPAGLETVFTEAALTSYTRLFHLLLTVRRTEHALNTAWRGAKRSIDRRIHLLHHQMNFIVNHLNCYLQIDVIGSAFERLLKAFSTRPGGQNLGCVEALHEAFLADVESQTLLHHPRLHSILLRLLHVCCQRQDKYSLTTAAAFEHLAATLFSTLTAASQTSSITRMSGGSDAGHISQLVLRLDYNHFFTKSQAHE